MYVKEEMKKKQQHPRTHCHWIDLVQCNEHCGMEQKRGACSRASHQALEAIQPLLAAFTTQGQSELTLLVKIQEYCYDNIHFMKAFQKIVVLFYKAEVLSEEPILKWYKDVQVAMGNSVFLEQMKKFVEWLKNAEEESESEAEEGD